MSAIPVPYIMQVIHLFAITKESFSAYRKLSNVGETDPFPGHDHGKHERTKAIGFNSVPCQRLAKLLRPFLPSIKNTGWPRDAVRRSIRSAPGLLFHWIRAYSSTIVQQYPQDLPPLLDVLQVDTGAVASKTTAIRARTSTTVAD